MVDYGVKHPEVGEEFARFLNERNAAAEGKSSGEPIPLSRVREDRTVRADPAD
jgi:hypothetical protein